MKEKSVWDVSNWYDVALFTILLFLLIAVDKLGIPRTDTQVHVFWLMLLFYFFEGICIICWMWTGLYEIEPEPIKNEAIEPLDIIKWCLGLRV